MVAKFDLTKFGAGMDRMPVSPYVLFGGGWTCDTDPSRRWRAKYLRAHGGHSILVLGRRVPAPGCFSIRELPDGRLDVAYYREETPREVWDALRVGHSPDATQYLVLEDVVPGWALRLIQVEQGAPAITL